MDRETVEAILELLAEKRDRAPHEVMSRTVAYELIAHEIREAAERDREEQPGVREDLADVITRIEPHWPYRHGAPLPPK